MAIWYIDFEGGNDANTGTSYAQRWKSFANTSSVAGGDQVRVMASQLPSKTTTLTGTWRNSTVENVAYVTYPGLSLPASATTPIVVTHQGHQLVTGDIIGIRDSSTNTTLGIWKVTKINDDSFSLQYPNGNNSVGTVAGVVNEYHILTSSTIELSSAPTQRIWGGNYVEKTLWTSGGAGVTVTDHIGFGGKEGANSVGISIDPGTFGTGKAAYWQLPSTLNLSSYTRVTLHFLGFVGTGDGAKLQLKLCSDTAGNTAVNTFTFTAPVIGEGTAACMPVTFDNGGALGASINSIALYTTSTISQSVEIMLDCIHACKSASDPNAITLNSMVGITGDYYAEPYAAINQIQDKYLIIEGPTNCTTQGSYNSLGTYYPQPYYGPSYSGNFYVFEPATFVFVGAEALNLNFPTIGSATAAAPIEVSGGWDRTEMKARTDWPTIVDARGTGSVFYVTSSYLNFSNFVSIRAGNEAFLNDTGVFNSLNRMVAQNCNVGFDMGDGQQVYDAKFLYGNTGLSINAPSNFSKIYNYYARTCGTAVQAPNSLRPLQIDKVQAEGCNGTVILMAGGHVDINTLAISRTAIGISAYAQVGTYIADRVRQPFAGSSETVVKNFVFTPCTDTRTSDWMSTEANVVNNVHYLSPNGTTVYIENSTGGLPYVPTTISGMSCFSVSNYNNTGLARIQTGQSLITQVTSPVLSGTSTSWKLEPLLETNLGPSCSLKVITAYVAANYPVTITAQVYRTSPTVGQLRIPGKQLSGITSAVKTAIDATTPTEAWFTVTATFTPTEAGYVNAFIDAAGPGGALYVSTCTVAQE